ncbi:hypothetical protein ACFL38_02620 [Candidatus Omnitrophota bacterium]
MINKYIWLTLGIIVACLCAQSPSAYAVPVAPEFVMDQHNGIDVYAEGDEFQMTCYVEQLGEKYTVMKNGGDRWYYASIDAKSGELVPGLIEVQRDVFPPNEARDLKAQGVKKEDVLKSRQEFIKMMEDVNKQHQATLEANRSKDRFTTYQVHVVFVEFPDVQHMYETEDFLQMIFSDNDVDPYSLTPNGDEAYGSARDYWDEVSFGEVNIEQIVHYPTSGEWFMMPEPRESYGGSGFYNAVIADTGIDVGPDDELIIVVAGREVHGGFFWPHVNGVGGNRMLLTERFGIGYGQDDRFLFMGAVAHEFGHMLIGLADHYTEFKGWGLMGTGCYGYGDFGAPNPEKPVHTSALSRIWAGFADVEDISGEGVLQLSRYSLPDVESTGKILHLHNEDADTHFYLECRQPFDNIFDSDVIGQSSGLVVWAQRNSVGNGYFSSLYNIGQICFFNSWEFTYYGQYDWADGYGGQASVSAFPGQHRFTRIGFDTFPSFTGNQYTNLHELNKILKIQKIISLSNRLPDVTTEPIQITFDLNRFAFHENLAVIYFDDDDEGGSDGNGNGVPEQGERIELIFRIENTGEEPIPETSGQFYSREELQCISGSITIEELFPGESIETDVVVFDILTEPAELKPYTINLLRDGEFILSSASIANQPPELDFIPDYEVPEGLNLEFTVSATDSNEYNEISLSIVYEDGEPLPDGVNFVDNGDGTGIFSWNTQPGQAGEHSFRFEATDDVLIDYQDVLITVVNEPPVLVSIEDQEVFEGGYMEIPVTATDENIYDEITLEVIYYEGPFPEGAEFVDYGDGHGLFSWQTQAGQVGLYTFRFQATDGSNAAIQEVDITVRPPVQEYLILEQDGQKPYIYEDTIVWTDYNFFSQIYMYYLGPDGLPETEDDPAEGEYQITNAAYGHQIPVIHDKKIVWVDTREGVLNPDIYMYSLGADGIPHTGDSGEGEYAICTAPQIQSMASVYGNNIVWQDKRAGGSNFDVYLYHLGADGIPATGDSHEGEYQITAHAAAQVQPRIAGNIIVWHDTRYGLPDIWIYHLGDDGIPGTSDINEGEYRVTFNEESYEMSPAIYDSMIVWVDSRNVDWDIYMYDLGPDYLPHTGDENEGEYQVHARIFQPGSVPVFINGNKIVWTQDQPSEVYLYDLGTDSIPNTGDEEERLYQLTLTDNYEYSSIINNESIVWEREGQIVLGILME